VSNGRTRRVPTTLVKRASVTGAAVLLGSLVLAPTPGSADPTGDSSPSSDTNLTLSEAQARVDSLNHQAEVASEQMNTIKVQMKATRERLKTYRGDLRRQTEIVSALRRQLIGSALSKYQSGGGLSTSTAFLVAKDPQSYLIGLSNSAVADNERAGMLARLTEQQRRLTVQQEQAAREVEAIAKAKEDLAAKQDELDKKSAEAESILTTLTIEQQQRLMQMSSSSSSSTTVSRSTPRIHDVPASGRAEVAVQTALAQVGDPYVYGAAGPDSFDCSGLTMYSWAAAGVSLSHSSSVQATQGVPVSISDLMPGDLIFYYSPISHVGMYIGNGQIVHAPHPGLSVEVVSMYEMPIAEARRVG
jgi:cell wall-associated NlpC family hydrolase